MRVEDAKLIRWASWAGIIGLAVALVGVLFGAPLIRGRNSEGAVSALKPNRSQPKRSQLKRIDLLARNGLTPGAAALELLVHNAGASSSVVSRARIEVVTEHELPLCFTQGSLPISENYGAELPPEPEPGDIVEEPLHQQIGADENDRFRIHISLKEGGKPPKGVHLVELRVSLIHDGLSAPLPMGSVLLSVPQLPSGFGAYYLESGQLVDLERAYNVGHTLTPEELWKGPMRCWQANGEVLAEAGRSTAARSQQLEAAIDGSIVPSLDELAP